MLYLAKLTDRSWQPVEDSKIDTARKTVTGSIAGFSTYGLVGSNMTVTFESQSCFPGAEVTITPVVQNQPPGYQLRYKWSTDGRYGDQVGTPDEKTGAITYKAKADAPDGAIENIRVEMFTQFATADNPPILTEYIWDSASATITIGVLSFKFDLVQTVPGVSGAVTTHVMVRQHKVKMVTGTAGMEVVHLFYYDAHIEYWFTGTEGRKQTIDPSAKSPDDINYLSQFSQYKTVGTEKIGGKSCQIKQTVKNGTTLKIWIWEEKNLPMRIQTTSSQGHVITEDYKDYEFVPIPESEFMLHSTVIIR